MLPSSNDMADQQSPKTGASVTPGEVVGNSAEYACGNGVYNHRDTIRASVVGVVQVSETSQDASASSSSLPVINVFPCKSSQGSTYAHVIEVGDVVLGRVMRINPRYVYPQLPVYCRFYS